VARSGGRLSGLSCRFSNLSIPVSRTAAWYAHVRLQSNMLSKAVNDATNDPGLDKIFR
jgi:hypothetical protein